MWFLAYGSVSDNMPIVTQALSYILLMQGLLAINPIALLPQSNQDVHKKTKHDLSKQGDLTNLETVFWHTHHRPSLISRQHIFASITLQYLRRKEK